MLRIYISEERNMFVAENFIHSLVDKYCKHTVSTDGDAWYILVLIINKIVDYNTYTIGSRLSFIYIILKSKIRFLSKIGDEIALTKQEYLLLEILSINIHSTRSKSKY